MASNTKNVKLGVCKIVYNGRDLGYTKGGVDVEVKTDTYKVDVDQFGKTPINEYIMGREVMVKAPLAETTLDNMVAIMPGATMTVVGGAVAAGSIAIATNPTAGETIVVNGYTVKFVAGAPAAPNEVQIGASASATAANLKAMLAGSADPLLTVASYAVNLAVVTITYGDPTVYGASGMKAAEGNAFTLSAGTAGADVTLSGATLTGGVDPASKHVEVTTAIGTDLLSLARELRLHPVAKPAADVSEDFVVPLAGTSGALKFAYKLDQERIFSVDFNGYPDPTTGMLFKVGA